MLIYQRVRTVHVAISNLLPNRGMISKEHCGKVSNNLVRISPHGTESKDRVQIKDIKWNKGHSAPAVPGVFWDIS